MDLDQLKRHLDEDERVALAAGGDRWVRGATEGYRHARPGDVYAVAPGKGAAIVATGRHLGPDISDEQTSEHIARFGPDVALRWVRAAREVLHRHAGPHYCLDGGPNVYATVWMADGLCPDVLALASVYGDTDGEDA